MTTPQYSSDYVLNGFDNYLEDSHHFIQMYKLPEPDKPSLEYERPEAFIRIIQKEVREGDDVLEIKNVDDRLTAWADWLGDIIVYSINEMLRLGLDPRIVLATIMASNFSKLDPNGNPIYDADGKVLKGPNFYPPEPALKEYIQAMRSK